MNPVLKTGNGETPLTVEEVVIRIEGLRKSYGEVVAVDGVDLTVNRSEVFGILGPNGAGKTTILELIEGLRKPDAGEIEIPGYDAVQESEHLKRIIRGQLQSTAFFDFLTVPRDPEALHRPLRRGRVREEVPQLGDLVYDFDFSQPPKCPMILPKHPLARLGMRRRASP